MAGGFFEILINGGVTQPENDYTLSPVLLLTYNVKHILPGTLLFDLVAKAFGTSSAVNFKVSHTGTL